MGGGAVIAAAAAAHRRGLERVLDGFRLGQATSVDRARSLSQLGLGPNNWVNELRENGVLKAGREPDSWYLDESANVARRDGRSFRQRAIKRVAIVMLVLFAIGTVVLALRMDSISR